MFNIHQPNPWHLFYYILNKIRICLKVIIFFYLPSLGILALFHINHLIFNIHYIIQICLIITQCILINSDTIFYNYLEWILELFHINQLFPLKFLKINLRWSFHYDIIFYFEGLKFVSLKNYPPSSKIIFALIICILIFFILKICKNLFLIYCDIGRSELIYKLLLSLLYFWGILRYYFLILFINFFFYLFF